MSKTAQAATNSRMRLGWRVVFVLCMLGVSIWGVSRIEFREDLLSMLPQHDPVLMLVFLYRLSSSTPTTEWH